MRSSLLLAVLLSSPAVAAVDFVPTFEAGTKWFTEPWSAAARAEMEAFLDDVGALFDSDATVRVSITDNASGFTYASAGSAWYQWLDHPASGGEVRAPAVWMIVVKGVHNPSVATDVTINWNLDVDGIYGGNSASLIGNIRGLGRHEMHHAFGASSYLYFESGQNGDPRGTLTYATLIDTLYRDQNGQPLLGTYNAQYGAYTVANFALNPDWQSPPYQSGLYFEARDRQGRVVLMAPMGGSSYIDFSHVRGISYVSDHPTWSTYVDTDFNFLRALGYPLVIDSALRRQPATVTDFTLGSSQASLTFNTVAGRHYRLATTTDLDRPRPLDRPARRQTRHRGSARLHASGQPGDRTEALLPSRRGARVISAVRGNSPFAKTSRGFSFTTTGSDAPAAMAKGNSMVAVCALAALLGSGCGTVPPSPGEASGEKPKENLRYSNQWRIEVSEGANSDGEFVFHVTPKGGETQVVTVEVDDGESENRVARTIRNAFEKQLAAGHYDVEIDDGEDVLIESYGRQPDFALQVISSTVKSVRLDLERE